jgi:hypothetical protein
MSFNYREVGRTEKIFMGLSAVLPVDDENSKALMGLNSILYLLDLELPYYLSK